MELRIPLYDYGYGSREYGECLVEAGIEEGKTYAARVERGQCEKEDCQHTEEESDEYWCGFFVRDLVLREIVPANH